MRRKIKGYVDPEEWSSVVVEGLEDAYEVDMDSIRVLILHTFFSRDVEARPLILSISFRDSKRVAYALNIYIDLISGRHITERHFLARIMPAGRLKIKFRDNEGELAIDYMYSEGALEKIEAVVDTYNQLRRTNPVWFAWNREDFENTCKNYLHKKYPPNVLWGGNYKFAVLEPEEIRESTTFLKVFKK